MSQNIKGVAELELKTDRFNQAAKKSTQELKNLGTKGQASIKSINQPITSLYNKLSSLGSQGKNASDKIRQGASQAKQAMTGLGTSGKMASDQITQSANTAKQSLSTLGQQGRTSMGHLGNAGTKAGTQVSASMSQASTSVRNLGAATQQTSAQMGIMVLGVAALGTSIGTTYTGMTALDKAQLKVVKTSQKYEKAVIGVARANDLLSATQLAVERFTLSIAAMERAGKTDTDAYSIAVKNLALQNQKLTTAYDDLAVKMTDIKVVKESVRISNVDLEDTYTNMTISIFNTVLMSAFLAKTLLPGLSVPTKVVTALTSTLSGVYKLLGPNIAAARMHLNWMRADLHLSKVAFTGASLTAGGFTAALSGVRIGLSVVKTGLHAMWVALGPIGWAVLGVIAVYEIWANNLFGVQEAVGAFNEFLQDMWELLKQISPQVQVLVALYERVFPPALEAATKATDDFNDAKKESEKTSKKLLSLEKERQRQIESGTATDMQQKILLEEIVQAKEKDAEAEAKLLEAGLALDDVTIKHNTRLAESLPLEKEIHRLTQQKAKDQEQLTALELAGNGQTLEAIQLREDLVLADENLIIVETQLAKALQGTLTVQEAVNDAVSQGGDDMTAYGEVAYDTAGNVITFDNALVSAGGTIEGIIPPTGTLTGAFSGLNGEIGRTVTTLKTFENELSGEGILKFDERANLMLYSVMALVDGADKLGPAFKRAQGTIMGSLDEIFGEMYNIYGEERTREYAQNFVDMGLIVEGTVDRQIKKYQQLNTIIDETKKNNDNLMSQTGGLTQATGGGTSTQTRKGLVTQTFFNSLPDNLKGHYRPQSGSVGLPTSLRDSIAARDTWRLSPAGLAARVLTPGLFLRRTESQHYKKFNVGKSIIPIREYKKRGLDMAPIFAFLKERKHMNLFNAVRFAKQKLKEDDARIEAERLQAIVERKETVQLLGSRLGLSDELFNQYTETEKSLSGFETEFIRQTGTSRNQFQNWIQTNTGRQNLANLLSHTQREEFLAALV